MDRPCLIRGLRIAWTVVWGIFWVLLIAMWVRSQFSFDEIHQAFSQKHFFGVVSVKGQLQLFVGNILNAALFESGWQSGNASRGYAISLVDNTDWMLIFDAIDRWTIIVPHWFLVLLSAAVASIPWICWRFSLRTLLLVTALIAIVLGLVVWAASG